MTTDLVGGQVQVRFDVMVTSLPQIRSGKLRALGVLGSKRFELFRMWRRSPRQCQDTRQGRGPAWAFQGTPLEIIARLNREINEGLAQPDIKARLADVGTVPMVMTADEFTVYIATEAAKWDKVVKIAGIKPQ